METDEKFNQIYQKIVNEDADEIEQARKKAQKESKNNEIILGVIIILNLIIGCIFYYILDYQVIALIVMSISFVIYKIIKKRDGKSKIDKYKKDFKAKIIEKMINEIEEQFEFIPQYRSASRSF